MLNLSAPAKLNLYLHITGKRSDGYHLLDTVFQLIDLNDTVKLALRQDGLIKLHSPMEGLPEAQNLVVKAAVWLKAHTHCGLGADIWLDKQIPSGAGLGGGSSDAATTLMGLNQLWQCGLSTAELEKLGLQLGADVPFFCSGLATAHARGIGEQLTVLPTPRKHFIVLYPQCHVPTPTVFQHPALSWDTAREVKAPFSHAELNAFLPGLTNDLQAPAQAIAPPIAQAITCLNQVARCEGVRMSGSGSAVFAQFATQHDAQHALNSLAQQQPPMPSAWSSWAIKALTEHPVLKQLTAQAGR